MFSRVAWVFFASAGTFLNPVLKFPGLVLMLIISISVVSRVKIKNILLRFQLKYLFLIWESQPCAVPIHVLDKGMFNAPEGALGTGDRP